MAMILPRAPEGFVGYRFSVKLKCPSVLVVEAKVSIEPKPVEPL
jgi:hypothetical protein